MPNRSVAKEQGRTLAKEFRFPIAVARRRLVLREWLQRLVPWGTAGAILAAVIAWAPKAIAMRNATPAHRRTVLPVGAMNFLPLISLACHWEGTAFAASVRAKREPS